MLTTTFLVEGDLTGRLDALLYSQSLEEREDHQEKWGEPPKFAGTLVLEFRNGKPCIEVESYVSKQGEPSKWTNQNWKDVHGVK